MYYLIASVFILIQSYQMDLRKNCDNKIIFDVGDITTYESRLSEILECRHLKELTIQILSNKGGWVVFSNIEGATDHECSYGYDSKLVSLPDQFNKLNELESLDISYLGVNSLPNSFVNLTRLKRLDISFNEINIRKEIEKLSSLPSLVVLKIYGCKFSEDDLKVLTDANPKLNLFYSEHQLIQGMKK
jgi:Leucine-rich repeat (LRR) protein